MRKTGLKPVGALAGLVILTLFCPVACRRGPQPSPELQSLLAADTLDRQVGDPTVRAAVRAFYTQTGTTLAWSQNKPTKLTDKALAVLASARDHGLDPKAYESAGLTAERDVLARKPKGERRQALAVFDVRLTAALVRLGRDVAIGRVDPEAVDRRWKAQRPLPPLAATLAASRDNIGEWLPALQPHHAEYTALMRALAALHGVETKGGWPAVGPVVAKPGASHPSVAILRRRLAASGDQKGQAAFQRYYFSGRNSSTTVSCSGTCGKKARRWQ